jgi:hypothetical protein
MNKLAANIIFAEFMGMELTPSSKPMFAGLSSIGQQSGTPQFPDSKTWKGEWYTNKLLKENVAPLASGPMAPCIATEDLKFTDDWTWFIPVWAKYIEKVDFEIQELRVRKGNEPDVEKVSTDMQECLEQDKVNIHACYDSNNIERAYMYLLMKITELQFYLKQNYIL